MDRRPPRVLHLGPDGKGREIRPVRDALCGSRGRRGIRDRIDDEATRGFYDQESLTAPPNGEWGTPIWLTFADEDETRAYQIAWRPGDRIATIFAETDEEGHWREIAAMKIAPIPGGFRVRYRGADLKVKVMPPHVARLAALMPEKQPPDTSNLLLCPMPGLVVALNVTEGEEVQEGQTLAIIEAMKMENVLRAERAGKVSKIPVEVGGQPRGGRGDHGI